MSIQLNVSQLEDLIRHYTAEKAKLEFQLHSANAMIAQLEASLAEAKNASSMVTPPLINPSLIGETTPQSSPSPSAEAPVPTEKVPTKTVVSPTKKRKPGRPPKNRVEATDDSPTEQTPKKTAKKKGPGRPVGSGMKLSEWDEVLITGLQRKKQVMANPEMIELFRKKARKDQSPLSETELKSRLNRTLQKLANKKGRLIKVPYEGKGYAYGLKRWIDKETGELKQEYQVENENSDTTK